MGGLSIWHWIIVGGVAFILFGGRFKISDVMGDVAKGIKAFKKGLAEDDTEAKAEEPAKSLEHQALASQTTLHVDKTAEAKKA
ncbi:sec-independent protein translocase protein TatA [Methylosinus sp. sav-2]|uniref:twin-arginine translocase TatA/TatE family subunit n=1 Tax=Methylosinus sp. sav-2 TaxID=2485168 RepID=UPI0004789F76|nr:twin-arginine translocase TatA/TatE family subunit [Methylosinus sp. sav-2]TDX65100.1 sec-independent protein translocase protein TatA [Methylosinus sp. sav-2]